MYKFVLQWRFLVTLNCLQFVIIIPHTVISLMKGTFLNDCEDVITIQGFVLVLLSYHIWQSFCYMRWHLQFQHTLREVKERCTEVSLCSCQVVMWVCIYRAQGDVGFVYFGDHDKNYCYSVCLEHSRCEHQTTNAGIDYGCITIFMFHCWYGKMYIFPGGDNLSKYFQIFWYVCLSRTSKVVLVTQAEHKYWCVFWWYCYCCSTILLALLQCGNTESTMYHWPKLIN
jgi:hypothetical protein